MPAASPIFISVVPAAPSFPPFHPVVSVDPGVYPALDAALADHVLALDNAADNHFASLVSDPAYTFASLIALRGEYADTIRATAVIDFCDVWKRDYIKTAMSRLSSSLLSVAGVSSTSSAAITGLSASSAPSGGSLSVRLRVFSPRSQCQCLSFDRTCCFLALSLCGRDSYVSPA